MDDFLKVSKALAFDKHLKAKPIENSAKLGSLMSESSQFPIRYIFLNQFIFKSFLIKMHRNFATVVYLFIK